MPKRKLTQEEKRYLANADTVRQVSVEFFPDCTLSGFIPDWGFNTPAYIPTHTNRQSFNIPDCVMGLLAEKLNLTWQWNEHPHQSKAKYEAFQARTKELRQALVKAGDG